MAKTKTISFSDRVKIVEAKMEDPKILEKFLNYKLLIEKLIGERVDIKINMDATKMTDDEKRQYMNESVEDNEFWNSYSVTLKELMEIQIDIPNKEFYLPAAGIDVNTQQDVELRIKTIERLCSDPDKPITLNISSYGGDVYSTFAVIDIIRLCNSNIRAIGKGQIMSGGAFILVSSPHRIMTEGSYLMLHGVQTWLEGSFHNIKHEMDHLHTLQDKIYKLLEKHSNKNAAWWEKKLEKDYYLSAAEAKALKLIDKVI